MTTLIKPTLTPNPQEKPSKYGNDPAQFDAAMQATIDWQHDHWYDDQKAALDYVEAAMADTAGKVQASAGSATAAANSATAAANSASTASTKATEAGNSATAAANSATTASTKATEAGNSATAAANSATTASTKATEASSSAMAAASSATAAATSAGESAAKSTEAATSAGAAANSANAAGTASAAATTKAAEAAASALTAVNAPGTSGTSTTSMTVGSLGSFTFTTQANKSWVVGQYVTVAQTAAPLNSMFGQITAYNSSTGSMTVQVTAYQGTGTATAWTIALSAPASPIDATDIGPDPNQIPLNQYLGTLAFQNAESVQILGGIINAQIRRRAPVTKTAAFTVADNEHWFICNGTAAIAITLPDASANLGREIMFKTIAAFAVNSSASNVVPLVGGTAGTAILPATAGKWATLVSDGTNWIIMQAA